MGRGTVGGGQDQQILMGGESSGPPGPGWLSPMLSFAITARTGPIWKSPLYMQLT